MNKQKQATRYGVFYRSNGRWTPFRTLLTNKPQTFTSKRELGRFLNSSDLKYIKNYIFKSRITVRKIKS